MRNAAKLQLHPFDNSQLSARNHLSDVVQTTSNPIKVISLTLPAHYPGPQSNLNSFGLLWLDASLPRPNKHENLCQNLKKAAKCPQKLHLVSH